MITPDPREVIYSSYVLAVMNTGSWNLIRHAVFYRDHDQIVAFIYAQDGGLPLGEAQVYTPEDVANGSYESRVFEHVTVCHNLSQLL
jgi:hypothetical protein